MAQTLIDITLLKDRQVALAIDATAQIISNANFGSDGTQTTEIVGVAGRKLTTSGASGIMSMATGGTDSNIDISLQPTGSGVVALGGTTTATASAQAPTVASSVNFVKLSGAATGSNPTVLAAGTDGTQGGTFGTAGTGSVNINTSSTEIQLQVSRTASPVNNLVITGSTGSNPPTITSVGTASNPPILIWSKGTGPIYLGGQGTIGAAGFRVDNPSGTIVNQLVVTPSATGVVPQMAVGGPNVDTNIGLIVKGQGTGDVKIQGTGTNDSVAVGYVGEFIFGEIKGTASTATVTITIAVPGVVTWTTHGFSTVAPQPVVFTTSGALPTGIVSGTVYYTVPSSVTTNTFQIATTIANALASTSITTTGSQSGTQTGTGGTSLSTGAAADVTGLLLTAGDWDVWGQVAWNANAATTVTTLIAALNSTSATLPGYGLVNGSKVQTAWLGTAQTATNGVPTQQLMPTRVSNSANTNIFLVAQSAFATNTNGAYGFIAARRRR